MNALNDTLAAELGVALSAFDSDPSIGIWCSSATTRFAAGADIGAMAEWDYQKVYADNYHELGIGETGAQAGDRGGCRLRSAAAASWR
jgi:enoyl-CoA hydratase/carnithine racemase